MKSVRDGFFMPPNEFGPIPFWFWNDDLEKKEIRRQIDAFLEKGIHGFVIHPRKGLTENYRYLSEPFMDAVEFAVKEAAKRNMTVFLYDEAMYPSGSAGGKVVQENPDHASKGLKMTVVEEQLPVFDDENRFVVAVCRWDWQCKSFTDWDTAVAFWKKCAKPCQLLCFTMVYSCGVIRGVHPGEDDDEPNAPRSADLLDKEAVASFIRFTHEAYYRRLAPYFGTTVKAMFTDEPSLLGRNHLKGLRSWSYGFLEDYMACGGKPEELPVLFEKPGEDLPANRAYRQALMKRLRSSFFKSLSDWCAEHQIALTGHPASSDDIGHLEYFQLPCQDLVWRYLDPLKENGGITGQHSTMGKCSADSARHRGRRRNGNECFGACGRPGDPWDLPSEDMKWYLDWLFVRGVNLIIPHAFFYSVRGDRRNERPPDVGMNSIWWSDYNRISNYIKRMCYLQTDSSNLTDIAVLCTDTVLPWEPVQALYRNQIEFNYLEAELVGNGILKDGTLQLFAQKYRIILVDERLPITQNQQQMLNRCRDCGVQVVPFGQVNINDLKENFDPMGLRTNYPVEDLRVTHIEKDGVVCYLLVNEGDKSLHFHATLPVQGKVELWNPWEGTALPVKTGEAVAVSLGYRQSLVIAVKPCSEEKVELKPEGPARGKTRIYTGTFTLTRQMALGQLEIEHNGELVQLWIDDVDVGIKLWKPYIYTADRQLGPGAHKFRVAVTEPMAYRRGEEAPVVRYILY